MGKLATSAKVISRISALTLVIAIFILNTVPFTTSKQYLNGTKNLTNPGPSNRVTLVNGVNKQAADLSYFTSYMPFQFNSAKVKVTFKNPSEDQQIYLGYKDQNLWHYNTKALSAPVLDNLNWRRIGNGPYLFQKTPSFTSLKEFLSNPPKEKVIGTFDYTNTDLLEPNTTIPGYKPADNDTNVDIPLRGNTTLYAYLNNEPFRMKFTKRDLNWYSDPDVMKISVYKGKDKVSDATIDDDGNSSNNHKTGKPQDVEISNPGPGLPESGVYKIVINASSDSVLTNIQTNLNKIVFTGPIFPVDNATSYPGITEVNAPTSFYTNSTNLTAQIYHTQAAQTLSVGKQTLKIDEILKPVAIATIQSNSLTKITSPISDVSLNGVGYFSTTPEQYFEPTPYKLLPINTSKDIEQADYVLTDYPGTNKIGGGWQVAERNFNINDAVADKKQLSWIIDAPNLSSNGKKIEIKKIELTLNKKGWIK
jgi:hypothetical protein